MLRDVVLNWLAADETPQVPGEVAGEFQERPGIADCRLDLETIADDAGVLHQPLDVAFAEFSDAFRVEAGECGAVAVTLVENRGPRQARLRALQDQELEL